jgi:hypothetical protein
MACIVPQCSGSSNCQRESWSRGCQCKEMGVTNCNDIRIGNAYRGALEAYLSGAFEPPRYGEVLASEKPPLESFFDEANKDE